MKAIELTQEQTDKLLEICKVLFPEYSISIASLLPRQKGIMCITRAKPYSVEYIHWYEFTMSYLMEKILNPKDISDNSIAKKLEDFFISTASYTWFIKDPGVRESSCLHPIDYLYEYFLKLPK